jgi:hypothetical protein
MLMTVIVVVIVVLLVMGVASGWNEKRPPYVLAALIVLSIGNAKAEWDGVPPATDSVIEDRRGEPPLPPRIRTRDALAGVGAEVATSQTVLLTIPLILLWAPFAPFHLPAAEAQEPYVPRVTVTPLFYSVQVASFGTAEDTLQAYRWLQRQYPTVLSAREAYIRFTPAANGYGDRYRALVGKFTTRDEADAFCETMKAVGGKCFSQFLR